MNKNTPPHPGEYIHFNYMEPFSMSGRFLAEHLEVALSTLNNLLNAKTDICPDMANRLSEALGRSPENWLAMQRKYDRSIADTRLKLVETSKTNLNAA